MKKILAALLALISMMTASAFAEDKLSIVCTTFPQYDWVRQILGAHADDVELTLLLDNGIDLHNYQPTAADIAKISSSDLFIYVGGESDGWVDDVLEAAQNPNLKAISMLASVEAKKKLWKACRKPSMTTTTAKRFRPLKTIRFRTELFRIGRAIGSLHIRLRWTERWTKRLPQWRNPGK